jgi:hypothetical protein
MSWIFPVYISWDGDTWRVIETSSGDLSPEIWRDGAWSKAGSVADLFCKGSLLAESQLPPGAATSGGKIEK